MATNFLHGVETIDVQQGPRPVQVVKAAVIGLLGIAPKGPKNEPILVMSARDAAAFGSKIPGFTIPQALEAIQQQGAGTVIVVNVFDEALHTTAVVDEPVTITGGKGKLAAAPLDIPVLSIELTELVNGEDYSIDELGNITVLDPVAIPDGAAVVADYKKLNTAAVTDVQLVGGVEPYTGAKCFNLCYNLFGFSPKILIAPNFLASAALSAEFEVLEEKLRARMLKCAPGGTTVTQAVVGRGPSGTIGFNTSNKRNVLLFPQLKNADGGVFDYSAYFAGVWANTINQEGYWYSPSNKEIKGVTGAEVAISAGISDPASEANLLNSAGIVTVFNSYGTGLRTWGNRSAAFPTNTAPENFLSVLLTADVIHESIEQASLAFVDKPINQATIDAVCETVNSFLRTLQGRGAIVDGSCTYNEESNPATELAAGHITFDISFMPPTPAERITFNSFIDINLLSQLR